MPPGGRHDNRCSKPSNCLTTDNDGKRRWAIVRRPKFTTCQGTTEKRVGGAWGRGAASPPKIKNNGGDSRSTHSPSPLQSQTSTHFLWGSPTLGRKALPNVENEYLIIQSLILEACSHRALLQAICHQIHGDR